ncbi:MAG: FtsX-like permease family protein [Rhodanobacter sp.]
MSIAVSWSVLRRQSLMPTLVLLQVALACAILCNVLFLMWQNLQPMLAPSGLDANNLILVDQLASANRPWSAAEVQATTQRLREVPGVRFASAAFGLPMLGGAVMSLALQGPNGAKVGVNGYMGRDLLHTLGLKLVAGRNFAPSEYRPFGMGAKNGVPWDQGVPQPIIITRALADQLFKHGQAIGKIVPDPTYKKGHGYQIVGVVAHLLRNQLSLATNGRADDTVLLARNIGNASLLSFAVRVDPNMHRAALRGVTKVVESPSQGPQLVLSSHPTVSFYAVRRATAFKSQRAALYLLIGVTLGIVIVTLIGIMGLTGFWVQRRTRQIGIRRALGARRGDILREFLAENALIVSVGVTIGMLLAYLGNALLMKQYELPRLPWTWLPFGAVVMLLLGQLAVLGPARRAAAVPPAVATRSV